MTSRWCFVLVLLPGVAAAQTDPGDLRLSDGYAQIDETMVNDPELDLEACDPQTSASAITIDISYLNTQAYTSDVDLKAWFETSSDTDCTGDIPGDGDEMFLGQLTLAGDDNFLDAAGTLLTIPDDLEDSDGNALTSSALTGATVLALQSACPNSGGTARDEILTLCIGLDLDTDGDIEDEPRGWVRFDIDTEAPPKPDTPTAVPLDGRVRVTTQVSASGATDDIREYRGFMRPQPEDPDDRGIACDQWGTVSGLREGSVDVVGPESATMEITGTNGVTYEICVYALDDLGNFSEPSDLATATPQEECDFIECYPDGFLESGCHAAGATPTAGLWLLLLALRRALERRA